MDIDFDFYTKNAVYKSWADHRLVFSVANAEAGLTGFRLPQRAAAFAVLSHLDISPAKPAIVVMPTGTGKTDTIFALMLAGLFKRTLLVVPSDALRSQMSERLESLSTLRQIEVVTDQLLSPKVHLAAGLSGALDLSAIEAANVTVATPDTLALLQPDALRQVMGLFTHVVFDEAHHVVADTWERIRAAADGKPTLYFTATPFRLDDQRISGRIVFN